VTKKKWLVIGASLVLILLVLGGLTGAIALFTDTETVEASVMVAGTLDISIHGAHWQSDVSQVEPGDSFVFEFTLQSDGNLPLDYNVVYELKGDLANGANPCYVSGVKIGGALSITHSGSLNSSGDSDLVEVEVVMPEEAGDEYQSKGGQLKVTIHATQQ